MAVRSCCVCRKSSLKEELIRIAIKADGSGMIVVDCEQRIPGRGVYVHASNACWNSRNLFSGAMRNLNSRREAGEKLVIVPSQIVLKKEQTLRDIKGVLTRFFGNNLTARKKKLVQTLNNLLQILKPECSDSCNTKARVRL